MTTITEDQEKAIADLVAPMTLPVGIGSRESACSIAAINLALTGELTDEIPECMSLVIGKWIIRVQDAMPAEIRNSPEWKALLPLAAGTGREHEAGRRDAIMGWMWGALEGVQPAANRGGFGVAWAAMTREKTADAAAVARDAAYARAAYAAAGRVGGAAAYAADAADAAYDAADAAQERAAAAAAGAARAAADVAWDAHAAWGAFWRRLDPAGLLKRLIEIGD